MAYQRKGMSYLKMKMFDSAQTSLNQALSLIPDDRRTISLLSECNTTMRANNVHRSVQSFDVMNPSVPGTCTGSVNIEKSRSQVSDFSAEEPASGTSTQIQRALNDIAKKKEDDTVPKKVFIIYDNRMLEHRPKSDSDYERPQRIMKIVKKLEDANILRRCEVSTEAHPIDLKHVLAVHNDESYIKAVKEISPKGKQPMKFRKYFHPEIVASKGTPQAVFLAAGAVVEACRRVVACANESAFAIVRPPGHHAAVSYGSGFCFLNNVAIAARYLQTEHSVKKILIVDFDVHLGDGTESIFYDDNSVMYCSIHRDTIFPCEGEKRRRLQIGSGEGQGFNVNVGLGKLLTDGDMLAVFDYVFLPLAKKFEPEFVLVSAGYDAAVNDPLGTSKVTPACFRELVWKLKSILNGKIVLALEGGYNVDSLSDCCIESMKALLDGRGPEFLKTKYDGACQVTWEEINQTYSELGTYWPIFAEGFKPPEDKAPDLTSGSPYQPL